MNAHQLQQRRRALNTLRSAWGILIDRTIAANGLYSMNDSDKDTDAALRIICAAMDRVDNAAKERAK
jgi:hypothetical protein